ncbi:uncharacterized protein [Argopecten irradians]|uniref:uncharacterized protein n=1 Tax=Argopecten irradians TaxID=31199 RepID=UPI003716CA2B
MCELCEIIPQRKLDIKNYIDKTEKNELVEIRRSILDTDALLQDNDCTFAKHSQELKEQTETLKRELDRITSDTLSLYQRIKEENDKLIETYKEDLIMYEKKLQTQVRRCKTLLQKGSDIEIYDCHNECEKKSRPLKCILQDVKFFPNKYSEHYLELALGDIDIETEFQTFTTLTNKYQPDDIDILTQLQTLSDKGQPDDIDTATQDQTITDKGRPDDIDTEALFYRRKYGQGTPSKEEKKLGMWTSPHDIDYICPITGSQAWTSSANILTLMDKKYGGTLIHVHEIKYKAMINGISLSPTTHILWVCDNNYKVMEMVSGRQVQRFRTKNKPRCLCVTASDHIIVGMSDKASKFTTEGQMVNTVSFSEKTTSRFGIPEVHVLRITECPITSNVAMITNKGNVLVMDSDFNELFVRRCESIDVTRFNVPSCKAVCLMYDSVGNIIIGKNKNREITLLSGDGNFLRVLNYKEPFSLYSYTIITVTETVIPNQIHPRVK